MNKKDCENIGYILSEYRVPHVVCEAFLRLDERIEGEYTGFLEVRGVSDEIEDRAKELVIEYNGRDWAIRKNLVKPYAECLQQAREEIYGKEMVEEG